MLQFLPNNLDLDKLLAEHPPEFSYHKDYFVYILNLLTEVPAKNETLLSKYGYVPLNANLLKKRVHNYKLYLNYLMYHRVLECTKGYVPGKKSKGFRYVERYSTQVVPSNITKPTLLKSIQTRGEFDQHMKIRYDYLYKWFTSGLKIDYVGALDKLKELYMSERQKNPRKANSKLNSRLYSVVKLDAGDSYFRIDDTSGRAHTNLTMLKKELRKFVTYNDAKLSNADIKCSQPTLSTVLLNSDFYKKGKCKHATIRRVYPALAKELPTEDLAQYVHTNQMAFQAYRDVVDSDLYEFLKPYYQADARLHRLDLENRKVLKELTYSIFFSSNRFIGQEEAASKRVFKKLFPEVYHVFSIIKKSRKENLPILLQKIETELVLNRAAKIFSKRYPNCPLFTIHDSIAVESSHYEYIKEILQEFGRTYCLLDLKIERENWY